MLRIWHKFVSGKAPGPDATKVRSNNWDDDLNATMDGPAVLGRSIPGTGDVGEIPANASGLSLLNIANLAHGDVIYRGATGFERLAAGITGQVLTSQGPNAAPIFAAGGGIQQTGGGAPYYGARAWVNFNGTGTVAIRSSQNVSSITDNGTGDYTVNFTTALADQNFAACITGQSLSSGGSGPGGNTFAALLNGTSRGTGFVRVMTYFGNQTGSADFDTVCVSVFR